MSDREDLRVDVVLGTRPEIVKLAPVVHALGASAGTVFTAQHYDPELSDVFFAATGLPRPAAVLDGVGGRSRAAQLTTMLDALTGLLDERRPDAVVVQGDTNSANAGAQAAHYLGIPVVHVEAGLRSHDRAMPEEVNRLVIGAVADVHCCPTPQNVENLLRAGADPTAVHLTGNPVVEATTRALPTAAERAALLADLGVEAGRFVLATVHRPENTDTEERLRGLLTGLGSLGLPVLLPLHPRTRSRLRSFGIEVPAGVRALAPTDHATFLALAAEALVLVSDSGGVQEEVTVLGKPLVVVRRSTERPESVEAGFAVLTDVDGIAGALARQTRPGWPGRLATLPSPYGDGRAAQRIAHLTLAAARSSAGPGPRSQVLDRSVDGASTRPVS
ncbi:non-hydrolyzing UDP-N-acetylglucosamine 2-epimerase [Kineococcus rhizosphaerae]|nr:UDP-N-acetylglucosamine 2-epimerase (non-hydrolyzing) [Kineococcus rhizosphaerae]